MIFVKLKEFDSKAELIQHLENSGATANLIGIEALAPRKFYALSSVDLPAPVGLVLSFHGVEPLVRTNGSTGIVLLGHDCSVTGLNLSGNVEFSLLLEGVFFEFIDCEKDCVIAVHELGAVKIDSSGNCKWKVHSGIVQEFRIHHPGELHLEIMDDDCKIIDTATGAEIKR